MYFLTKLSKPVFILSGEKNENKNHLSQSEKAKSFHRSYLFNAEFF